MRNGEDIVPLTRQLVIIQLLKQLLQLGDGANHPFLSTEQDFNYHA
jgi:hypothetical protein